MADPPTEGASDEESFRFLDAAACSSSGKLMREKTLTFCFRSADVDLGGGSRVAEDDLAAEDSER